MSYNSFKVLSNQYMYFSVSFSNTNNAIVSNTYTDSVGRNTFQYANLDGETPMNYYFYSNFSKNIKKWNLNVGVGLNTNGNIYYNLANGELKKKVSSKNGGSVTLRQYIQQKYHFKINYEQHYKKGR